jgi:F-type H+-transporting ATPase subunit b
MRIDWWTLGLQTVNALVLIWLLARFLFRPIASVIAERKAAAAQLLDEAASRNTSVQALEARAKAALAEIEAGRTAAIGKAAEEAQETKQRLLHAARAEAEHLRGDALAEIDRARRAERHAEDDRASLLAVDIAERLLDRLPPSARVSGFVDGLVQAIADLPDRTRADFSRNGAAVLSAPRALTPEEEATLRAKLAKAFGRPVDVVMRADPALLAGLELEDQHASVRNSLRADLERIRAQLLTENGNAR